MADETPKSNTSPTTTASKPSKLEGLSKAADMLYGFGSRSFGDRGPGKFASIAGFFSYGTHRDGRKGVVIGGKFIPTSNATSATTSTSEAPKSTGSTSAPAPSSSMTSAASSIKKVKPSASWAQMMRENFPESFKQGGLVRGAGKAVKGRGRGKMV